MRRTTGVCVTIAALALQSALAANQNFSRQRDETLFPPENLGLLEMPDRDRWQKPELIMDTLGIADGSRVADIGAGAGWFTTRLAIRVGPNGIVYAQDVQRQMLDAIRRRVSREGLSNVRLLLGEGSSPNLPHGVLDAILVVDSYQEVSAGERVTFLKNLTLGLKANGRIGIVNYKPGRSGPGPAENVRVDSRMVEEEAKSAALRVLARETLPYQYLLVLGK